MSWLSLVNRAGPPAARIAPVRPAHAERLAAIHAAAFARPWEADDFEAFLSDPVIRLDGLYLGRDDLPAGFVVSRVALDEAEILSLALARSARGLGLSRRLLAQHLSALDHAGVARVHLEVEEGNGPALALYLRSGFRQSGTRPGYYARPDGTRGNALSMTRHLNPSDPG